MSLKTAVASGIMAYVTSEQRLLAGRARVERRRQAAGAPHVIEYFHQVDDPYSHLAVQALAAIRTRYDVEIRPHLVGPPADWAAPERGRLVDYARLDAGRLAARAGLVYRDPGAQPDAAAVTAASALLAALLREPGFLETAADVGAALWAGRAVPGNPSASGCSDRPGSSHRGEARRAALGHFMSGMIYYGREWYWGVDRLHYLESRLERLGARKAGAPAGPVYVESIEPPAPVPVAVESAELHFYLSFRSPYTSIVVERVKAVADAYGAELRLRFVLPMVMRGLPVPRMKSLYFALDTAREARRLGVPFGRIADPVGRPVERGYSLLPWARAQGRGYEYCLAFLRGSLGRGHRRRQRQGAAADRGTGWARLGPSRTADRQ
jgi:2-hydroxychromene-2-carboxylate isomerase